MVDAVGVVGANRRSRVLEIVHPGGWIGPVGRVLGAERRVVSGISGRRGDGSQVVQVGSDVLEIELLGGRCWWGLRRRRAGVCRLTREARFFGFDLENVLVKVNI